MRPQQRLTKTANPSGNDTTPDWHTAPIGIHSAESYPVKAVFVDEQPSHAADRLVTASDGQLECSTLTISDDQQVPDMISSLLRMFNDNKCDILLLGYTPPTSPRAYSSVGLAASVRQYIPGLPVVIVTSRPVYHKFIAPSPLRRLYDHWILPDGTTPGMTISETADELADLAVGWKAITDQGTPASWFDMSRLLQVELSVLDTLRQTEKWPTSLQKTGIWIRDRLLKHQGVLLDCNHAAMLIGSDITDFQRPEVQQAIVSCRYTGPFSGSHVRWWKDLLSDWVDRASGITQTRQASLTVRNFLGIPISPPVCGWCGGNSNIVQVCVVCESPVDREHCLNVVYELPYWVGYNYQPRICFTCVSTGNDSNVFYAFGTRSLLESLRAPLERQLSAVG